mmetsp:Transcript_18624/g.47086  ORF Transcript_18624/g.47086 Transcript_18624/m.47086 type:complete len:216 (-) Transcript_18624:122-769(-)
MRHGALASETFPIGPPSAADDDDASDAPWCRSFPAASRGCAGRGRRGGDAHRKLHGPRGRAPRGGAAQPVLHGQVRQRRAAAGGCPQQAGTGACAGGGCLQRGCDSGRRASGAGQLLPGLLYLQVPPAAERPRLLRRGAPPPPRHYASDAGSCGGGRVGAGVLQADAGGAAQQRGCDGVLLQVWVWWVRTGSGIGTGAVLGEEARWRIKNGTALP